MQLFDFLTEYKDLTKRFEIIQNQTQSLAGQILEVSKELQNPEIWKDNSLVAALNKKHKTLTKKQDAINLVKNQLADFGAMLDLIDEDPSLFDEKELTILRDKAAKSLENLWLSTLLSGEYDNASAIITFQAGAGGEEAQDWAEMVSRMYTRYAENQGYRIELIDESLGDGAGIKGRTLLFEGENAYGYLKTEKGVHRLVRISPFDSSSRRHTSFASVEVFPYIEDDSNIEIRSDDLKIDTYRSGGAGGQHVNKTESAVRITHIPTGIVVQCQNERSQIKNKELALKLLKSRLIEKSIAEKEQEKQKKFGEAKKIEWGSQIRSYVLHPYNMVKDHRTNYETSDTSGVLDGDLQPFINEYLKASKI